MQTQPSIPTLALAGALLIALSARAQAPSPAVAVRAFFDICVKSAPSFAMAPELAKPYGFRKFNGKEGLLFGVNQNDTLVAQIKENQDCSIDMPPVPTNAFPQLFAEELGKFFSQPAPPTVPFRATVGSTGFVFNYESRGFHRLMMVKD